MTTKGMGTRPLPDGWTWTTVKEMTDIIQYGHTESANHEPVGPKFLRITDIQNGQVDWDSVPYCICTEEEHRKYALQNGDIVFARTGATTGKSFLILNCPDAVFASYLIRLRVPSSVDSKYLSYFFQTPFYWSQIVTVRKGSAQPGVNATILAELRVPLAPLTQQKSIVAEIEKQFTRLDQAVVSLRRLQTNLARYKASVLKAACEGRLVPQDPTDEPAEALLQRILSERRTQWQATHPGKKYEEPSNVDTTNLPNLPESWEWASLDQVIFRIEAGKSPRTDTKPVGPNEYGVIKVSAMSWGEFLPEENKALLENSKPNNMPSIKAGDLLLSRANTVELVGAVVLVKKDYPNLLLSDKSLRLVPSADFVMPQYLLFALRTPWVREVFENQATGTSDSMRNLSQEKIRTAPIALPPLTEQHRIVAEVERRLSVITTLEQTLTTNLARAERLRQSILHRAFTGQLV